MSTQEKFKRGFRRLFRRCSGPLGRDRRFSSAGEVSLTGAFHVEEADAVAGGHHRSASRRRQPRGSDASSVHYYAEEKARSVEQTSVSVHCQRSPTDRRSAATGSGAHLSVPASGRYWPVNTTDAADEAMQLAEL